MLPATVDAARPGPRRLPGRGRGRCETETYLKQQREKRGKISDDSPRDVAGTEMLPGETRGFSAGEIAIK